MGKGEEEAGRKRKRDVATRHVVRCVKESFAIFLQAIARKRKLRAWNGWNVEKNIPEGGRKG